VVERQFTWDCPEALSFAELETPMRQAAGELYAGIALDSIYRGEQLAAGRKAVSLRIFLQSDQRTLEEHDLLGLEPQLVRDCLERVDGTAVHVGLASFAQPAIVNVDAETAQQTFERGWAAIHAGGLHDLGHKKARPHLHRPAAPAARRINVAGETRSTSMATSACEARGTGRSVSGSRMARA